MKTSGGAGVRWLRVLLCLCGSAARHPALGAHDHTQLQPEGVTPHYGTSPGRVTSILPLPGDEYLASSPSMLGRLGISDFRANQHRYYESLARSLDASWSLSLWVITQDRNRVITSLGRFPGCAERMFVVYIDEHGHVVFEEHGALGRAGGRAQAAYRASVGAYRVDISDGVWHHVALVKRPDSASLYVDGVPANRSAAQPVALLNFALCIAADCLAPADESQRLRGRLDEYRLYDRALADSELMRLHGEPPHEVSPASEQPTYDMFIDTFRRMCAGRVLGHGVTPMAHVLDTIPLKGGALVLEFGVWFGHSLNRIALAHPAASVFGFDSFYGLPEDWSFPWVKGSFNVQGKMPIGLPPNAQLIPGWYNESLPLFLQSDIWKLAINKYKASLGHGESAIIALLHIDCDLYSSTKTVLSELAQFIGPGTVIVFDELLNFVDYEKHEMRALYEFAMETNKRFEVIGVECVGVCQPAAIRVLD